MLQSLLLRPLNRLLKGEAWASDLLKPHAGKGAELKIGSVRLRMLVTESGQLEALAADVEPDVRIALPASALVNLSDGADQLTRHATVSGDAGFAETISLLLKHLRPDVGAALSPMLGDVIAHRVETGLTRASTTARQAAANLGANIVEYVRDEHTLVVKRDELVDWRTELSELESALRRLEKRVELTA
ncbi:MAG: sterol-binding protein [Rhodocyclales bacterium]|nr:sterol-binding protein [Rhodocyclales bacterium]